MNEKPSLVDLLDFVDGKLETAHDKLSDHIEKKGVSKERLRDVVFGLAVAAPVSYGIINHDQDAMMIGGIIGLAAITNAGFRSSGFNVEKVIRFNPLRFVYPLSYVIGGISVTMGIASSIVGAITQDQSFMEYSKWVPEGLGIMAMMSGYYIERTE